MGFGYNGQTLAVYSCEFLEMLRHKEGFIVGQTIYNKKKEFQY
jgi:hypothetical protein